MEEMTDKVSLFVTSLVENQIGKHINVFSDLSVSITGALAMEKTLLMLKEGLWINGFLEEDGYSAEINIRDMNKDPGTVSSVYEDISKLLISRRSKKRAKVGYNLFSFYGMNIYSGTILLFDEE